MMNLAEYRRSNTRLADFLPWAALVDEGIILNKDGRFKGRQDSADRISIAPFSPNSSPLPVA